MSVIVERINFTLGISWISSFLARSFWTRAFHLSNTKNTNRDFLLNGKRPYLVSSPFLLLKRDKRLGRNDVMVRLQGMIGNTEKSVRCNALSSSPTQERLGTSVGERERVTKNAYEALLISALFAEPSPWN